MTLRPYLLALCALVLAGIVAWDYWPKSAPVPAVPPSPIQSTAVADLNPISQRQKGDFQALFDHPLFDPTRSPLAVAVAAPEPLVVEQASSVAAAAPILPPQPVLLGTVTSPLPGGAYLGDDSGGPVVFLRPGEMAQGLTLFHVFDKSAEFIGPEGQITLPLVENAPTQGIPTQATPTQTGVADMTPTSSSTLPAP